MTANQDSRNDRLWRRHFEPRFSRDGHSGVLGEQLRWTGQLRCRFAFLRGDWNRTPWEPFLVTVYMLGLKEIPDAFPDLHSWTGRGHRVRVVADWLGLNEPSHPAPAPHWNRSALATSRPWSPRRGDPVTAVP
jgi:hypothetical protein